MTFQQHEPLLTHDLPLTIDAEIAALQERARSRPAYRVVEKREALIDRIHDLMEAQNISRAELARQLGVTRGYITQLLSGDTRNFKFETLVKLGEVFGQELHLEYRPRVQTVPPITITPTAQPLREIAEAAKSARNSRLESARQVLDSAKSAHLHLVGHPQEIKTGVANWGAADSGVVPCEPRQRIA